MHFSTQAFNSALEYFHQALQAPDQSAYPDKFRILLRISDCHYHRGEHMEAKRFLDAARSTLDDDAPGDVLGTVDLRETRLLLGRGSYDEALKVGYAGYRRLKNSERHADVAAIQTAIGQCYLRLGRHAEAEDFFTDALSCHRRTDDEVGIAAAHNNLGLLHKGACRWQRSLSSFRRSLDIFERLGLTQQIVIVQLNLGGVHLKMRRFPEAVAVLTESANAAERLGDQLNLTKAMLMLGRSYVASGSLGKAEKFLVRAHSVARENDYVREYALAEEYLGELLFARRQFADARLHLDRALSEARAIAPEGDIVAEVLRRLAETDFKLGHVEKALEAVAEGIEVSKACESFELGYFYRVQARCHARSGDIDNALESIAESVRVFAQNENIYEKAASEQCFARLLTRAGGEPHLIKATQVLTSSIADFDQSNDEPEQILSYLMLASVEQKLDNTDNAMLAVYEADRLADETGERKFRHAIAAMRKRIERSMTRSSTRLLDEFSILSDIQSGANSRAKLAGGLESILALVMERLGANAGFVSVPTVKGKHEVAARSGVSARDSRAIQDWYLASSHDGNESHALIVADFEKHPGTAELRERLTNASGMMLMQPLGFEGEALGVLCVRRSSDLGPIAQDALHFVAAYASLISLSVYELLRTERRGLKRKSKSEARGFQSIVTDNRDMIQLLNLAERVAHSDATVLLQGETGTGKGLIAYAIHLLSNRREGRFIHVNCAALPEQLLESELFGHARGSFTGAVVDKEGLLQQADGGTIFLDEIGKTTLTMQGKLLQFLDSSRIRKVGSNDLVPVDVRVICASKSNLLEMCAEGRFLEDFFYRINDFPLTVPPLRDRVGDIELLAHHYIEKMEREMTREVGGMSEAFMTKLRAYAWPGNVRELEKVIKRAIILSDDGEMLDVQHLPAELLRKQDPAVAGVDVTGELITLRERIEALEQRAIADTLSRNDGNKSQTAIQLGISYPNLLAKIKRYNIQ